MENAEYRVSKTAWLDLGIKEDREFIVRKVNRRMEDATELSHEYAELQQVFSIESLPSCRPSFVTMETWYGAPRFVLAPRL